MSTEFQRITMFRGSNANQYNFSNQPPIIKAIIKDDEVWLSQILSTSGGGNAIITDTVSHHHRRTPLHLAAALGRTECLRLLIRSQLYPVNCRDLSLVTPLHRACRKNHVDCVQLLLREKADFNARTRQHLTPLHICAIWGAYESAQLILAFVSNLDVTDSYGATALHHAVYNSHLNMVQLLLQRGAKVDIQDKYGQRPVHYAAVVPDAAVLKTLVENGGADVNVRNKNLLTPAHLAVAYNNVKNLELLVELGVNMEAQDIHGNTPSHWTAYFGCMSIFENLAETMKMDRPNLAGQRPLHLACSSRSDSIMFLVFGLLDLIPDINVVDKYGRTPLHYAATNSRDEARLINLLISRNADCDAVDCDLETPLHKAVQHQLPNIVEALINCGANVNAANKDGFVPLHMAAMANNAQLCRVLIKNGADPTKWDSSGRTAHYMAVYKGSIECFLELMSSPVYADLVQQAEQPLFPETDAFQRSLLHYAAANKCPQEFIRLLLLRDDGIRRFESLLDADVLRVLTMALERLDLKQQDCDGRTPLHYLCRRPNETEVDITSLIHLFVELGADISVVDNLRRFPFHYAVANGYTSTLRYLIDPKWFQSQATYRQLFTLVNCPLKFAAYYGHCSALNELLNYGFSAYEDALEIAVYRLNWDCAHRLVGLVSKQSLKAKLAFFVASRGYVDGLRLFLDLPMAILEKLLFVAAGSKQGTGCVETLLFKGVRVFVRDRFGRNALFYAAAAGNHETIQLLLTMEIRFVVDHRKRNVFHLIAHRGDLETFGLLCNISKSYGYFQFLCDFLLAKDDEGFCPIEIACVHRHQPILEYYINNINRGFAERLMFFAGIVANSIFVEYILNKNGFTFLHSHGPHDRTLMHYACASLRDNSALLKLLIDLSFDVNLPDEKGMTPILHAAFVGNPKTIRFLLDHTNANALAVDLDGNTILHFACMSGRLSATMMVIEYAKERGHLSQLVHAKNIHEQTCLHLAAKMSMPTVIEQLLRAGASISDEDANGYMASMYCARDHVAAYCILMMDVYREIPVNSSKDCQDDECDHSETARCNCEANRINGVRRSLPADRQRDEMVLRRMRRLTDSAIYGMHDSSGIALGRNSANYTTITGTHELNSNGNNPNPAMLDSSDSDIF